MPRLDEDGVREVTKDSFIYQFDEIGRKTSTGGWFVSEGEVVLLAHDDVIIWLKKLQVVDLLANLLEKEREKEGFSELETEVLKQLSSMGRLVVCARNGAVQSTANLALLRHGLSIWIDAPLDMIARDAIENRSQLSKSEIFSSGSYFELAILYKELKGGYASTDTTISLHKVASQLGYDDLDTVTKEDMALERICLTPLNGCYCDCSRHRWTGRYEAYVWDKNYWNESQNKKGRQGSISLLFLYYEYGAYDDEKKATAHAYDLAALKYWGPETILNFPRIQTSYSKMLCDSVCEKSEQLVRSIGYNSLGIPNG
ncbi:hypothetical protein ACSBR1_004759 [Camellia fascicularis]